MTDYFVNKNAQPISGDNEVHKDSCARLPNAENRISLGKFYTCQMAVVEAQKHYANADGCAICSPECHTS